MVIQHGLWGDASNTQYLADLLAKQLGGDACCHVLNSGVSSKLLTYDGIDVCGDRLHALIQQTHELLAKEGRAPTHISMIGWVAARGAGARRGGGGAGAALKNVERCMPSNTCLGAI